MLMKCAQLMSFNIFKASGLIYMYLTLRVQEHVKSVTFHMSRCDSYRIVFEWVITDISQFEYQTWTLCPALSVQAYQSSDVFFLERWIPPHQIFLVPLHHQKCGPVCMSSLIAQSHFRGICLWNVIQCISPVWACQENYWLESGCTTSYKA